MRALFSVLTCIFLVGCPAYVKTYVHNEGAESVLVTSLRTQSGETTIRAGHTKTIQKGSESHVCFQLGTLGESRIYNIDPNSGPYIKSTAYGGRLDLYIRGNRVFVQTKNGEQQEIVSQRQCNDA
jgi:hypothetical protein